jgi:hypothetical protein
VDTARVPWLAVAGADVDDAAGDVAAADDGEPAGAVARGYGG